MSEDKYYQRIITATTLMGKALRFSLCILFLILEGEAFPQVPSSRTGLPVRARTHTGGGLIQQEEELEKSRKLEKRITKPRPSSQKATPKEVIPQKAGSKIIIKKIRVEGATLISQGDIKKITSQYEGKELSLSDMQKVADLITDEYRKRGYIASRAYIPPQTIKDNILIIRVIEGKL